jgi:site-specific DNA-cytosine methylase
MESFKKEKKRMTKSEAKIMKDELRAKQIGMLDTPWHEHSRRVFETDSISPTVTAVSGGTHHIKIFDTSKYRVRKLTPTEYGRLQGFPMEDWTQVVSDSQAYKQFGNAVTVNVAKAIAEAVSLYLRQLDMSNDS